MSGMFVPFLNKSLLSYFFLEIVDLSGSQPLVPSPLLFKLNKGSCIAESLRGKPSNFYFFYSRVVVFGSEIYCLRIKKVALTVEAFTGGVLLGVFKNFPNFTVKHLR